MEAKMALPAGVDGELYLGGSVPPDASARNSTGHEDWWGTGAAYEYTASPAGIKSVLYERVLLVTKDPTTLPHTRSKCVKWAQIGPIRTCVGWKVEVQWFFVRAILRVSTSVPTDIGGAVEDCLKEGAIAAAIAAILTGGTAAASAAAAAVKACLVRKLGDQILAVSIDLEHYWGDWE